VIAWCWTLLLLRDAPCVEAPWLHRVLSAIWLHATHVRRYLSYYCSQNTDLTGEALGLFYAGTLFPEFREAERWREVGARVLAAECDSQVCRDGVHFERSTCYHRYIAETYLHFLLLADRNRIPVPDDVVARVQQMIEFLLAIRQADGTTPALGDDDGGCVLPLEARPRGDARGLFGVAATRFRRRDFAWAAGGLAPEILWLLGPHGLYAFDAIRPSPPSNSASRVFPSGGYVSMRSGWGPDAHHVIVDIGPIGCPVSGGHGHADLLGIQCSIYGEPCLVDAGTYCYTGEPHWRDYFRSTAAHSSVLVDGVSQADPAGPFGWRGQPRVRLREWHSTPDFDFLDAEHDGYRALPDPVVHRRRVIFVKPGYWILVDDLSGAARHQLELTFQFGPLAVALGPHPWARAETPGGRVLWICPFPSAPVQPSLKCGELSPIRGWISTGYGERQPAPMLIYSFNVALPWRIVTLLLPDRQALASPPQVRAVFDDAGQPVGIAFERPRRMVRFDDRAVSVERD
jgi:heparinase II/III-like protein